MKEWCRRWDWPRAIGRLRRQAGGRRDEGAAAGHWLPPRVPPTRQGHHTRCSLLTAARCSLIMSVWCRASLPGVGGDWRERESASFCSVAASHAACTHLCPPLIATLRTRPVPGTESTLADASCLGLSLGEGEGPAASERATTMPEQRRGVVVASSEAGARM